MKHSLRRNLLFLGIALLIISASLAGARMILVHADAQARIVLPGQTAPLAQKAQVVQDTAQNQPLQLSIGLQLRDRAGAENLLAEISDPASPYYHHYLTPQEFTQLFAPGNDQVQQVVSYLRAQGLTVNSVSANNLLIDATGTVAQAENSFQTHIKDYRLGKHTFHANTNAPSLPHDIGQFVASIGGLDSSVQFGTSLSSRTSTASASQPTGLDPATLEAAYNLGPLHQSGINGQGQTIALFTLDGYQTSDIAAYFKNYNLTQPTLKQYLVDNFSGAAGSGAVETTLDIEMIGAVAPQSTILAYEGPNSTQGINDTYTKIVNDNAAKIVSTSWGLCEASTGSAELQTLDNIFVQGGLQGISFFAAAGDAGAYDCQDNNLAVDAPASDPNVTGVGATALTLNDDNTYASESAWSDPTNTLHGPHGAGSGGGISSTFTLPTWQTGTGVSNSYSNGHREVPDVAAFGNPAQGFNIYCTVTNAGCPSDGWTSTGGSSAAAPFWAGSFALVDQYLLANSKNIVGQANPMLYKVFNTSLAYTPFHDVTSGNNLYYPTTSGYDLASGLGSPNVTNLARAIAILSSSSSTTTPIPTPTTTATSIAVTPTPTPAPTQLVQNGGFESGTTPWSQSSSGGFTLIDTTNPHTGSYSAYMCGYVNCNDKLSQSITIPASYTSLTLTFWWNGSSGASTQCINTLIPRLQTTSGTTIKDTVQICNTQATDSWVQQTVDLSSTLAAYKGQTVTLLFLANNGTSQSTTFFVDDVSIAVA